MPILEREIDIYPGNLLESIPVADPLEMAESDLVPSVLEVPLPMEDRVWWAMYTRARREKDLMRRLLAQQVPFYGPVIPQRHRSSGGRIRTSYIPLFQGYVFVFGDQDERYAALTTNCVSRCLEVPDPQRLTWDLRQIQRLIQLEVPLTLEARLGPPMQVRVRRGRFAGVEGRIIRREGQTRLLVAIDFLQQGASMVVDELDVELRG